MLFWFVVLGLLGLGSIVKAPGVLAAINPYYALAYILNAGPAITLAVLAAVFLSVTGGEALYADMGHFGRFPIRAGGSRSCCPVWCSTTSARAPCC